MANAVVMRKSSNTDNPRMKHPARSLPEPVIFLKPLDIILRSSSNPWTLSSILGHLGASSLICLYKIRHLVASKPLRWQGEVPILDPTGAFHRFQDLRSRSPRSLDFLHLGKWFRVPRHDVGVTIIYCELYILRMSSLVNNKILPILYILVAAGIYSKSISVTRAQWPNTMTLSSSIIRSPPTPAKFSGISLFEESSMDNA